MGNQTENVLGYVVNANFKWFQFYFDFKSMKIVHEYNYSGIYVEIGSCCGRIFLNALP